MLRLLGPFLALVLVPAAAATISPQRDPVPALSIADGTTAETNFDTIGLLEVALSAPSGDPVTVHWATADGTADSTDYLSDSGTLTIPPGQTLGRIGVLIKGDALDEPDETIYVDLSDATNATIARARGTLTIIDDDPAPFRLLDAYVDARWSVHRRYTRATRFVIHRPSGTVVAVRCKGRGCPLRVGRKLLPGTRVDVRIEAPYKPLIGRVYQYRIRAGRAPAVKALCLPPAALVPEPC
jgi:Calx-beta domain-containing protein